MAFRHGQHGAITHQSVIWTCPTCQAQNTGPLEAGCSACKAGADAGKAVPRTPEHVEVDPTLTAYKAWRQGVGLLTVDWDLVRLAWFAGAAWATGNREPLPPPLLDGTPTTGGWGLFMGNGPTVGDVPLDPRAAQTVLAALAFYRDNQLAYGAVPGQLDAMEVSALIEKLTPHEVPA